MNQEKIDVAILALRKYNLRKNVSEEKKKDNIYWKEGKWKDNIIIKNRYVHNNTIPNCIKQYWQEKNVYKLTIIVGNFNTSLTGTNRWNKKNIRRDIEDQDNTVNNLKLFDIYIYIEHYIQHKQKNTFFSCTCGTLTKQDHLLDHKDSLNKFCL